MNSEEALTEAVTQIDLGRFAEVVKHLLPAPVSLAICQRTAVHAVAGEATADALLDSISTCDPEWHSRPEPACYVGGESDFAVFGFKDHGGERFANLIVEHGKTDESIAKQVVDILRPLFECMQTELRLADEITVMADELTARYEELNLVYDTQDQASDYEETQTHLKTLVDNCRDYLDVSFSALILRDKAMTLYDADEELDASEVLMALDVLKGQMYTWVSASKEIAVVNDVNDKLGAVLCPGVPFKVVAVPILSGANEACGMLVIARTYAQGNFTNSDKNLCDVMARKASKIVQASYDTQTGFMKRSGVEYLVNRALQSTKVVGLVHAVFLIDIDRMQVVNDTLGYEAGDMVIEKVATTIQDCVRAHDTIARTGGDEFCVLISDCPPDVAKKIATKIGDAIERLDLAWEGKQVETSASIGVALVNTESKDIDTVMAAAEVACAAVKDRGGNGVSLYQAGDEELVRRRSYMDLVGRIQDTLRSDRFELFCQPILPLNAEFEVHAEVLLRMRDEAGEMIPPGFFIPAAERYHLMPAIDRWVVAKALTTLQGSGLLEWAPDAIMSINLSGQTFTDEAFPAFVDKLLENTRVPADRICFEVTETTAIADIGEAQRFIDEFHERGVSFSLDDFGTGLSSFSYLRELSVDFLKIDGSFVKEICVDPISETMVSAINQVGHTMGLKTIGEFVENESICEALAEIGVDYGQGYGLGKPIPMDEYIADVIERLRVRDAG